MSIQNAGVLTIEAGGTLMLNNDVIIHGGSLFFDDFFLDQTLFLTDGIIPWNEDFALIEDSHGTPSYDTRGLQLIVIPEPTVVALLLPALAAMFTLRHRIRARIDRSE